MTKGEDDQEGEGYIFKVCIFFLSLFLAPQWQKAFTADLSSIVLGARQQRNSGASKQ